MIDIYRILHSALAGDLKKHLRGQPLYELSHEQISDACELIKESCVRIQTGNISREISSMCIQTTMHEETIFQYASTDTKNHLAHWVRQYSECHSASERDAHAAYVIACSAKALGALADWMRNTEREAWSHAAAPPADWPWDLYCQVVERQIDPNERIRALEEYVLCLEPITSLPCLISDELTPIAYRAIENAIRTKGGIVSGMERNEEIGARDTAIIRQGRHYVASGMSRRNVATAVHAWLEREVARPIKHRADWVTLETDKALTRKSVEGILKRNFVL